MTEPLVQATGLRKSFPVRRNVLGRVTERVLAVDNVSFAVPKGGTLGLVGESGSGKSTLGRLTLRLIEPDSGAVVIEGHRLTDLSRSSLRNARRRMQMVFQDPYASLNPSMTIAESVGEPLRIHERASRTAAHRRAGELLEKVGLGSDFLSRYPYELSGGQRQRVAVARALALHPGLIVCDEPVSALDVSTQSQVINMLKQLQDDMGLSYLFISHDLSVVRYISDRIAVMYLGRIVEEGPADEVYERPRHPYTQALLSAIPVPNPQRQRERNRIVLDGDLPSASHPPAGCRFHTRCPYVMDICRTNDPALTEVATDSWAACHLHTAGPQLRGASLVDLPMPRRIETAAGLTRET